MHCVTCSLQLSLPTSPVASNWYSEVTEKYKSAALSIVDEALDLIHKEVPSFLSFTQISTHCLQHNTTAATNSTTTTTETTTDTTTTDTAAATDSEGITTLSSAMHTVNGNAAPG